MARMSKYLIGADSEVQTVRVACMRYGGTQKIRAHLLRWIGEPVLQRGVARGTTYEWCDDLVIPEMDEGTDGSDDESYGGEPFAREVCRKRMKACESLINAYQDMAGPKGVPGTEAIRNVILVSEPQPFRFRLPIPT